MSLPQAYVQFRAMDAAGNTVRATAPGKLTITAEGEDPGDPGDPGEPTGPVAIITGPDTVRRNRWAQFDALQSTSDSEIVTYVWDMGDGSEPLTEASIRYRWRRPGTYTVTLTVTDQEGDTATATVTVEVTR
jgi:bacillopeptidase F